MVDVWTALKDPLLGKTSLSRVIWLYGVLGSVLVMAAGMFFDAGNELAMKLYTVFGLLFSIYVTVATFQCARNCRSKLLAQVVRVSAVITLVLLPLFAYWELSGGLESALSTLGEVP